VQGEGFLECRREGDDAVFAAFALGDPDAASAEVDVGEPDPDELGDPVSVAQSETPAGRGDFDIRRPAE
jgi:hypothetical protein